jgi:putative membrane protein
MMFWWGEGMTWWGYVLMSVSMVLFWGVVILGIVALVRYLGHSAQAAGGAGRPDPSAEQVLAERFARGEIDEQEYQSRRAALRDRQQSTSGT